MRPGNDYPSVSTRAPIVIEGYCLLNMDYGCRKDPCVFEIRQDGSWKRVRNHQYDPAAHPDPYPEECARVVSSQCIGCRYFGWCDADEDLM